MYTIEYDFGDEFRSKDYTFEVEWCDIKEALCDILASEIEYKDNNIDLNTARKCVRYIIEDDLDYYVDNYKHDLKEYFKQDAYKQMKEVEEW